MQSDEGDETVAPTRNIPPHDVWVETGQGGWLDRDGDIIHPSALGEIDGPIYDREHLVVSHDRPVGEVSSIVGPDPLGMSIGFRQELLDAIPRLLKNGDLRMVPETDAHGNIVAYCMIASPGSTRSWIEQVRHEEEKRVTTRQNQYIHKSCGGGMVVETDINGSWFRCLRCGAETPKTPVSPDPILVEAEGGDPEKAKRYDQRMGPEHAAARRLLDAKSRGDVDPTWGNLSPPRDENPDEMA